MARIDVNTIYSNAERAFSAGDVEGARRNLLTVMQVVKDHPAVFHLFALVEKRRGQMDAAHAAFQRAAALAPNDATIIGNHANLLSAMGQTDLALDLYNRSVRLSPDFIDARYNLAVLLQRLGRSKEALAAINELLSRAPREGRALAARGDMLRSLGQPDEADEAYSAALRIDPGSAIALVGRGRLSLERGEVGAAALYARAQAKRPRDLQIILGHAEALEAENDASCIPLLSEAVARNPLWIEGHEVLARMRSEAGDVDGFADHYGPALAAYPTSRDLHKSYWRTLAKAERHAEALAALKSTVPMLGRDPEMILYEAILTSEAGMPTDALALIDRLDPETPGLTFSRGRIALRAGQVELAAKMLEEVVVQDAGSINGWANLDVAWRLLGDDRHLWLSGQPGLVSSRNLGLSEEQLQFLREHLRRLHVTRAHPIGQSLRGGTQTRGRLFDRRDADILLLREAIADAVADHLRLLPPEDLHHPLLRWRRSAFSFAGSWSVRLKGNGFHVSHIHPEGIVSSACHIELPVASDRETREGWLEIGRPPAELNLDLQPLFSFEPKAGWLVLFPSYLFHGTRAFSAGERLTVAFDMVPG